MDVPSMNTHSSTVMRWVFEVGASKDCTISLLCENPFSSPPDEIRARRKACLIQFAQLVGIFNFQRIKQQRYLGKELSDAECIEGLVRYCIYRACYVVRQIRLVPLHKQSDPSGAKLTVTEARSSFAE